MSGVCKNHFTGGSGSNNSKNTIQYTHLLWGHWSRIQRQSISNTNCTSSYISLSRRQNFKDRKPLFFSSKALHIHVWSSAISESTRPRIICSSMSSWSKVHLLSICISHKYAHTKIFVLKNANTMFELIFTLLSSPCPSV